MDANEYQRLAMRTSTAHDRPEHRMVNAVLGLAGEAGELASSIGADMNGDPLARELLSLIAAVGAVADRVKKGRYHGHSLDYQALIGQTFEIEMMSDYVIKTIRREGERGAPPPEALYVGIDVPELTLELGDAQWYVAQAADAMGVELGEVMQANIRKLAQRYPDGFSAAASLGRAE